MADQITLQASTDRAIGSRASRRLRKEGRIPAVLYGAGDPPTPVAVEWTDLRAALTTPAGMNALITLRFDEDERLTIVKDMQRDPVRREVTHVDFIVIDRFTAIDVEVPIHLEHTDADQLRELVVDQQLFTLPVSALPGTIPNELVIDCSPLTLDEPIRAGSIALPQGVELNVEPDEAIVTANVPVVEIPEPEVADEGEEAGEVDGEAGEEGAEAEAGDGSEDGESSE